MNGRKFSIDDQGPWGHQNCRCVRVPITKPWKDLGFSIVEPPSLMPDAGEVFNALPAAHQMDILGPARFAAWKRGDFPISDWAVRRSNKAWRDSYVPAPVPPSGS